MMSSDRIKGKVARITSDRELILNIGSNQGVKVAQYFYVRGEPETVRDPDTKEVLGQISPIKVVVQIAEVDEKFSIARTFRTKRVQIEEGRPGGALHDTSIGGLSGIFQPPKPPKYEQQVETLRLDPRKGSPMPERDSIVSVGDIVESVNRDENIDPVTTTLFR